MSDCTCDPAYLLDAAERALSPAVAQKAAVSLFGIAPNPFEIGRRHTRQSWESLWTKHAAKLVWC